MRQAGVADRTHSRRQTLHSATNRARAYKIRKCGEPTLKVRRCTIELTCSLYPLPHGASCLVCPTPGSRATSEATMHCTGRYLKPLLREHQLHRSLYDVSRKLRRCFASQTSNGLKANKVLQCLSGARDFEWLTAFCHRKGLFFAKTIQSGPHAGYIANASPSGSHQLRNRVAITSASGGREDRGKPAP
jgi:hypothetical protein